MHGRIEGSSDLRHVRVHEVRGVRVEGESELVTTLILLFVGIGGGSEKGKSHRLAFDRVAILAIVKQRDAVAVLDALSIDIHLFARNDSSPR